jgi:hypothetical protein
LPRWGDQEGEALESRDAPIERVLTDVRAEIARADGSYERRRTILSAWRVSIPLRVLWRILLVATGVALYAGGGKEALVTLAQWIRATAGI